VLGKTPPAANWTSCNGNGEKSDYTMHESLNRSMHFALKETDFDQVRRGIDLVETNRVNKEPRPRVDASRCLSVLSSSDATKALQSAWISCSISAGSETVQPTLSRNNAVYLFRHRWMRVSPDFPSDIRN
jgi:hypothetical protein